MTWGIEDKTGQPAPIGPIHDWPEDINACRYRRKCGDYRLFLMEAHRFLTAQAYTQEEMEDFMRRLNDFLGIPNDI